MKLTESGEVKELVIYETKIADSGNSIVPIDEIFKCVLNANCITMKPAFVTKQTTTKLNETKRGIKFSYLRLYEINEVLDVDSFVQFIKNNFNVDKLRDTLVKLDIKFNNLEDTTLFKNRLRQILKN
uniref:Uncharacterized protein n=1 Tax=Panagrolaimus davidi TaxID=227884 RepID=A0A914QXK5_9BILA